MCVSKVKNLLNLIIMLLLVGCDQFTNDIAKDISGGYFYRDEGGTQKMIWSYNGNIKGIDGEVISYDYNEDFIVAIQKPNYNEIRRTISFHLTNDTLKYPTNSREEIEISLKVADSIIMFDDYYKKIFANKINYWIISHKNKIMYGPLSKIEFLQMRRALNVPSKLNVEED